MDFYKASLLQIKFHRKPSRWMYFRHANASCLWFLWFEITWRRSWLPQAAYMQGWNAAFRQFHGINESGRTQRAADFACTCRQTSATEMQTDPACPVHGMNPQSR